MVKKIINWTANGFFRTFGKFLFFFIITCIIAILVGNGSIKLTDLLGIDIVYADTNASYSSLRFEVEQCTSMAEETGIDEFGTCQWDHSTSLGNSGRLSFGSSNGHLRKIQMQLYAGSNVWPSGTYKFVSTIAVDPKDLDDLINYPQYFFRIYGNTTSSSSGASSGLETISSQSCYITNNPSSNYTYQVSCGFNTSKDLKYINVSMEAIDNYHVPVNTSVIQWDALNVFSYNESPTGAINYQTTIIQNELNETNNNLNNINDTLQDDDVDEDTEDMVDFLTDFDFSGSADVSSLITLPIDFIANVFLNDTTSDLCAVFRGKNICLPNGKLLWNRTYSCNMQTTLCDNSVSISSFKQIFSILVGGYFAYKMLRGLVRSVDEVADPTIDSVQMADLGGSYTPKHRDSFTRSSAFHRATTGRRSK